MNDNKANTQDSEVALLTFERAREVGSEYGELMIAKALSTEEEERLNEILELATLDESLDFWISLETLNRGAELGLTTEDALCLYENQKAWLREYLGTPQMTEVQARQVIDSLESGLREQLIEVDRKEIRKIFEAAKVLA